MERDLMGWIKVVPKEHECSLPIGIGKGTGSIWECPECKQWWKFRRYRSTSGEFTFKEWNKIPAQVVLVEEKKPLLEILGLK